jgi:hypothetical protein
VATPEHSKLLPLVNYVHIVALAPDLLAVSFCNITEFLKYNSTIELLFPLQISPEFGEMARLNIIRWMY